MLTAARPRIAGVGCPYALGRSATTGTASIASTSSWSSPAVSACAAAADANAPRRAPQHSARRRGARLLEVATCAADTGLLRFYQRLGFRLARIERDAFTPAAGYPPGLTIDGIPLLDRVWLDRAL